MNSTALSHNLGSELSQNDQIQEMEHVRIPSPRKGLDTNFSQGLIRRGDLREPVVNALELVLRLAALLDVARVSLFQSLHVVGQLLFRLVQLTETEKTNTKCLVLNQKYLSHMQIEKPNTQFERHLPHTEELPFEVQHVFQLAQVNYCLFFRVFD
jgi:hypothetical protein